MSSGKKNTVVLVLGICGGLLLAGIIAFVAKILLFVGVAKVAEKSIDKKMEGIKNEQKLHKLSMENFKKTQELNRKIARMEGSNECRFWRQQLKTSPKAENKIRQYCYYGPEHEEAAQPNSDKIWKTGK